MGLLIFLSSSLSSLSSYVVKTWSGHRVNAKRVLPGRICTSGGVRMFFLLREQVPPPSSEKVELVLRTTHFGIRDFFLHNFGMLPRTPTYHFDSRRRIVAVVVSKKREKMSKVCVGALWHPPIDINLQHS